MTVRRTGPESSACRPEKIPLRLGADKVPFVASDVDEYSDLTVGFDTRRGEELHARRCHPRVRGVEVLDLKEETDPPGSLPPDGGGLVFSISPREQQAGRRAWRPDYYPPLGAPIVRQGRRVLHNLEAQSVHEEADSRVVLADHDGDEAEMHGASIGGACLAPPGGRTPRPA
jgi:hypothetical protein